jgi:hypothetical protein
VPFCRSLAHDPQEFSSILRLPPAYDKRGAVPKGPLAHSIELEASEWPISERRELQKPVSMWVHRSPLF